MGSEFLSVFVEVAAKASDAPQLMKFLHRALNLSNIHSATDRATRNAGALLLAALPAIDGTHQIANFDIDEAVIRGTINASGLLNVNVHQLDCRGADLSQANFDNCGISSLIANDASRFSFSFPIPVNLSIEGGEDLSSRVEIFDWLERRGRNAESSVAMGLASPKLKAHPIYGLLGRTCRVRSYWLRAGDDVQADKILRDPNWATLSSVLRETGFLREEQRQASGKSSTFTHVRQRERILLEDVNDTELIDLFSRLETEIA